MFDNEFPPLGGGTGVVNLHLFEELAAYPDVVVDLVTSSRSRATYEREHFSPRITIHKVPVDNRNIHHATNRELLRYVRRGMRLALRLARRTRYDLSFAFAGVPAGAMSLVLAMRHRIPYVVSLQGPDVPGFEARYNTLYPFLKPLLRRIWRNAGAVIAISEAHRALAHAFMPDQEIRIIHNGVDTTLFAPATAPVEKDVFRIVCSGRLIERKGQHHLLDAFAGLCGEGRPDIHLDLVGTGDMEARLKEQAARLGIADRVTFRGFVAREMMPQVYARSRLFVLPSQSEGMSMALLEAMATGLPVIVTDTGGSRELVPGGENGRIIPWADVPALTGALREMLADPHRLAAMGAASRRIAERFSWPAITRQYLELFTEILPRSAHREVA